MLRKAPRPNHPAEHIAITKKLLANPPNHAVLRIIPRGDSQGDAVSKRNFVSSFIWHSQNRSSCFRSRDIQLFRKNLDKNLSKCPKVLTKQLQMLPKSSKTLPESSRIIKTPNIPSKNIKNQPKQLRVSPISSS